jgi:hypothetical protein
MGHREEQQRESESMTRNVVRIDAIILFITGLMLVASAQVAPAQQPGEADAVLQTWRKHVGVQSCGRCHYEPNDAFSAIDTSISRQNELKFWLANDKHAIARRRVEPLNLEQIEAEAESLVNEHGADIGIVKGWLGPSNVLSLRMCEQLEYDVADPQGYEKFRDNCLTCHGGYRSDAPSDKAEFAGGQPGISCNYCHQIGERSRWVDVHGSASPETRQQWRTGTPAEKTTLGMRDLVSTSAQANLCFDCHVGNRSENKFVTHEMYAAGHPPLPSVELHTFCDQMPQHWQPLDDVHENLPPGLKAAYFASYFPGISNPGSTFWNTRKLLIGALAARVKTLDLLIASRDLNQWADYSLYDCAACHHELKSHSERQLRGYPAAPGRPRQPEWANLQLAHIGSFLVQDEPEIMRLEAELAERIGEQPFGVADRVAETASQLRQRIEAAIDKAEAQPVDGKIALGVLRGLARTPSSRLISYDAARQVVWAMQVIADEMEAEEAPLDPRVKKMIANLDQPEVADGKTGVAAKLPAGRDKFIYAQGLRADLQRRAAFNPGVLVSRLREINAILSVNVASQQSRLKSHASR